MNFIWYKVWYFICLVFCLTSQSTAMVMSRWSVNLTTLSLGKHRLIVYKRLTSTSLVTDKKPFLNQWKEENDRRKYFMKYLHEIMGMGRDRTHDLCISNLVDRYTGPGSLVLWGNKKPKYKNFCMYTP